MRWLALLAGVALIALAIVAVTRVADTREGLVAEVVTLLGALAGVSLLIYGLAARPRPREASVAPRPAPSVATPRPRSSRDLLLGVVGIALALVLLGGLAFSGGFLEAAFGLALLLPMLGGCLYLCLRYLRASRPD